jgi:hypothetical protein
MFTALPVACDDSVRVVTPVVSGSSAAAYGSNESAVNVVATPPDKSSAALVSSDAGSGWKLDTEPGAVKEAVYSRSSPGASTWMSSLTCSDDTLCGGSPGWMPTSKLPLSVLTTPSTAPKVLVAGSDEFGARDADTSDDKLSATACPAWLDTAVPAPAMLDSSDSAATAPPGLICEALATSDTTAVDTWSSSSLLDAFTAELFASAVSSVSRTAAAAVALLLSWLDGLFSELARVRASSAAPDVDRLALVSMAATSLACAACCELLVKVGST